MSSSDPFPSEALLIRLTRQRGAWLPRRPSGHTTTSYLKSLLIVSTECSSSQMLVTLRCPLFVVT
jgi:hypothetical protein